MNLEKGGRGAIERMVEAYGFKTRQALCDHLGISKSTLATRYMRDSFPAEWVIQCALETGTSLNWLTTGHGSKQTSGNTNTMEVAKYVLSDGALREDGFYIFDKGFLPSTFKKPFVITDNNSEFICDKEFAVEGSYVETWNFIKQDTHSLKRYTNFQLFFDEDK